MIHTLTCQVCKKFFEAPRFRKCCQSKCENHRKWLIVKAKQEELKLKGETMIFPAEALTFINERNKEKFQLVEQDIPPTRIHSLS